MIDRVDDMSLAEVAAAVQGCTRCALATTRKQAVPGAGTARARLMLISQSASEADNITGQPFSGPSAVILDRALERVGLERSQVYLTTLVKCVPLAPRRRDGVLDYRAPKAPELRACRPWLERELALVQPRVLVLFGVPVLRELAGPTLRLAEQRGAWLEGPGGVPAIATWQPAYLLRMNEWDRPRAIQGWHELLADLRAARARAEDP